MSSPWRNADVDADGSIGDAYRESIFMVCSGLLLLVSAALTRFLQN